MAWLCPLVLLLLCSSIANTAIAVANETEKTATATPPSEQPVCKQLDDGSDAAATCLAEAAAKKAVLQEEHADAGNDVFSSEPISEQDEEDDEVDDEEDNEEDDEEDDEEDEEFEPPICNLYFAPSTIPGAGWGLFTARDFRQGQPISASHRVFQDPRNGVIFSDKEDVIIPIMDTYKTFPFRGAQRFLPWLAYVWPEETGAFYKSVTKAFPIMEEGQFKVDEGLSSAGDTIKFFFPPNDPEPGKPRILHRMNAVTPGLALQVNSHDEWDNVYLAYDESREFGYVSVVEDDLGVDDIPDEHFDQNGDFADDDLLQSTPRSYYHHRGLEAKTNIPAGSELFMWYGQDYDNYLESLRTSRSSFETLEEFTARADFSELNTEADKRWLLNTTSMTLRTDENASFAIREGDLGADLKTFSRQIPKKDIPKKRPGHSVEWLRKNGVCVDELTFDESEIEGAGHGAYSKHGFRKGQVVSHAPLLALKRDDLVINELVFKRKPGTDEPTEEIGKETLKGEELLKNYCFGHPDSELLLFPYSPMINYINHDAENPNTIIRWVDGENNEYLDMHPIDVMEQHGGTLRMEYVAIREIAPDEEVTIDYGPAWVKAWEEYQAKNKNDIHASFRHEIGVPQGFFPEKWLDTSVEYEIVERGDLKGGELQAVVWKHNGKPFTRFAHRVGLPEGTSDRFLKYSQDIGVIPQYSDLLKSKRLKSDEWFVWNATQNSTGDDAGQWFAQRYKSDVWHFNMHYISAWNEKARQNFLGEIGRAGFDVAMDGIGNHFGVDNMTCFHLSYMGVSECDKSFTHTDVYASGDVSYNIIWPLILVDGSMPELNLQSDDGNIVVGYKYEYDTAILMGDYGYHYTSAINGYKDGEKRVVVGMYCGQMDRTNAKVYAHLYDGEDPAPFMGQFEEPYEYHWSKGNPKEHRLSRF
ncbi:MAG: hypothetical protein SGILL_000113 [Bacillariaceae sp.]